MHRAVTVTRIRSSVPGAGGSAPATCASTASAKSASTCRRWRTIRPGSSSWARIEAILVTAQSSYGDAMIADCTDSMIDSSGERAANAARNQCSPAS